MDKARETLVERRPTNEILEAHLPELLSPDEKLIWLLGDLMNAVENYFGCENPKRLGHINSSAIRILDEIVDPLRSDLTRLNAKVVELERERLKLRTALIETGRNLGAFLANEVSSDFLTLLPEEARLLKARLARAVEVKALVWRDQRGHAFPDMWDAKSVCGVYQIEERSASDSPAYVVTGPMYSFIADVDALESAKAAAQADFEQRIRSALVLSEQENRHG